MPDTQKCMTKKPVDETGECDRKKWWFYPALRQVLKAILDGSGDVETIYQGS